MTIIKQVFTLNTVWIIILNAGHPHALNFSIWNNLDGKTKTKKNGNLTWKSSKVTWDGRWIYNDSQRLIIYIVSPTQYWNGPRKDEINFSLARFFQCKKTFWPDQSLIRVWSNFDQALITLIKYLKNWSETDQFIRHLISAWSDIFARGYILNNCFWPAYLPKDCAGEIKKKKKSSFIIDIAKKEFMCYKLRYFFIQFWV